MGGKSSKSTSNTVAEPWEASQPFLKDLIGDTQGAYGAGSFDIAPYGGERVAPQGALTQMGQDQFGQIGAGGNPFMQGAENAYGNIMNGDPYRDLDTVKQNVLGDVIPAVSSRFANSGMLDSSMAQDTISRAATQAIAPIEYGAWEGAQQRQLNAMGMAGDLSSSRYIDPQMLTVAGGTQDAFTQQTLDAEMSKYYEAQNQPYDEIQRAASLGMGFGGMGGEQKTVDRGPKSSMLGGMMQMLSPMAAMAAMRPNSDRRLKTDIKRIGKTAEGYPKYSFKYLWDKATTYIGVMADEVPEEITSTGPGGYMSVDYSKVTL